LPHEPCWEAICADAGRVDALCWQRLAQQAKYCGDGVWRLIWNDDVYASLTPRQTHTLTSVVVREPSFDPATTGLAMM
jgi:hypothetical protein